MRHCVDTSTCSPLPSGGYRGRPFREPCGSPPSQVLWAHTTTRLPLRATSGLPRQQVLLVEGLFASRGRPSRPSGPGSIWVGLNRGPVRERQEVLLGSRGIHLKACPGLGTPATPNNLALSVIWMLPSARLTASASRRQSISELNPRGLLPCCLRFARRSPGQAQDSLPACLLWL
jgi:hypothetical protein